MALHALLWKVPLAQGVLVHELQTRSLVALHAMLWKVPLAQNVVLHA